MSVLPHPGCSQEATLGPKLTLGPLGSTYEGESSALNEGSAQVPQSAPNLSVPLNILACVSINKGRKPSRPPLRPGAQPGGLGLVGDIWEGNPGVREHEVSYPAGFVLQVGARELAVFSPELWQARPGGTSLGDVGRELSRLQNRTHTTPFA